MGKETAIEWTHHTFNPWWGCVKVSPGCAHCYAETFSKRTGNAVWGMQAERRFFGDKHWNEPLKWNAAAQAEGQRKRVFCASMADVFEDRPDLLESRQRLIQLIDDTPWLDWLLLTKRPENIEPFLNLASKGSYARGDWNLRDHMKNVWLGTSAEDQERWDTRLPILMGIPAVVHFVSAEPLLGPIEMGIWRPEWLIVGGESGPKARPMERAWVESLRDQCDERTAFLFKQWGGVRKETTGRELDGRTWDGYPSAVNGERQHGGAERMSTKSKKDVVEVASHGLFSDPCRDCKWWVLATPDYRRCERGASPSSASQFGRCAKREPKTNSENAQHTHGPTTTDTVWK